jgi:hypothetical protein
MAVFFLFRRILPAALLAGPGLVVACGARGPLDITVIEEVASDAEADVSPTEAGADATDASGEADAPGTPDAPPDRGPPGFDGGPLFNCGSCIYQSCEQQVLTCLESTDCRNAIQCAVTTCLSGGTPDPTCILGCANGDTTAIADLGSAFLCVEEQCGADCTSVLGSLGGLGGGGGGGSGGGGGGG